MSGLNEILIDPSYAITIATTLAFTVGIIQVIHEFDNKASALSLVALSSDAALYFSSGLCHLVPLGFVH